MDWIRDHLWETWLMIAVLLALIEMVSLDLIFVMLAVGAVVGMLTALVGLGLPIQLLLALGSSVGLLAFLRPDLVKRFHGGPTLQTGPAALIGRPVHVLTPIAPNASGRIKIGGDEWTALPYDEFDELAPGERAEVVEIRGATAYIRRA